MWSDRLILHQEVIFFAKLYEKNDFSDPRAFTLFWTSVSVSCLSVMILSSTILAINVQR